MRNTPLNAPKSYVEIGVERQVMWAAWVVFAKTVEVLHYFSAKWRKDVEPATF